MIPGEGGAAAGARARRWRAAGVLLLLLHAALLADGARRDALTVDEESFIVAGIARWQLGDHRLMPENGEIPMRMAGLVPYLLGARVDVTKPAWATAEAWSLAGDMLAPPAGAFFEGPGPLVLAARVPAILAALLLAALTWRIAARIFGEPAAVLTLLLHATHPLVVAHGRLATADVAISLALLAAAWAMGRVVERASWGRVAASCAAVAACFVVKFSALLLLPAAAIVLGARLLDRAPWPAGRGAAVTTARARAGLLALLVAVHAAAAVAGVWTAYGMERPPPSEEGGVVLREGWGAVDLEGPVGAAIEIARRGRLLPEPWLFGLAYTTTHARSRAAFALGRFSHEGWPWYFPVAFVLKTPPATLALIGLGAALVGVAIARGRRGARAPGDGASVLAPGRARALLPLLALGGVYWIVALGTSLNIGARHVLPTLPILAILAGASGAWAAGSARPRGLLVAALGALAALEGAASHPLQLAWMSALAGPESARHRRLTDSNLDWGQDAIRVARWMEGRPGDRPVHLAWFGRSDPGHHGAAAARTLRLDPRGARQAGLELAGGTYVVSATDLVQIGGACPGEWTPGCERDWLETDAAVRAALLGGARGAQPDPAEWQDLVHRHRALRLGRLCAGLRRREPDEVLPGGGVLVFELTDAEVAAATTGSPP